MKARYIEPARTGWKVISEIFTNPWTGEKTPRERIFIPGSIRDHNLLGADYIANLQMSGPPELVRAWLEGDWDVVAGAYFPEFTKTKHVLRAFPIPKNWKRFTASDWGSSRPFWTGWFAIVQEEMRAETETGEAITLLPGALVIYREWYGEEEKRPGQNLGLKLPVEAWAKGVLERCKGDEIAYHVVDSSMFDQDGGPSLAERAMKVKLGDARLQLRRADKRRLPGWNQIRYRLRGDHWPEPCEPMLFMTLACPAGIRTLAALQHDDIESRFEDADSDGEDHPPDGIRYGCMSRPRKLPDPEKRNTGPKPGTMDWLVAEAWRKKPATGYRIDER